MTKIQILIDQLAEEIGRNHEDGICDWCGSDTREKPNQKIYEFDWHIGDEDKSVYICSTCRVMTERAHTGQKITNSDHPDFGRPMSRFHATFMGKGSLMNFNENEEALASLMIKRMQKRIGSMS